MLSAVFFGGGVLVLRGRVPLKVLLPVVAVAQAGLHSTFVALAQQHHHDLGGSAVSSAAGGHWSWHMLVAHGVGTAAAGVVWRWCERAVEVVLVVPGCTTLRPLAGPIEAAAGGRVVTVRRTTWLVSAPRRGPPAVAHVS